jgi:hypothetical protein
MPDAPARRSLISALTQHLRQGFEMNRSQLSETVGALAGLAFAVLLLFGFATIDPLREATDQELIDWWSSSSNREDTALSFYFILACVPCFLLFLASLRGRLASAEGGSAPLSGFVFAAGICFASAMLIGDAARGVIAHSVIFNDEPVPGPDTLRYVTSFSATIIGVVAMPAAAIAIGAASWLIVRTGALPSWVGYAGIVVVLGTIVAVAVNQGPFASPLLQLWVVAAGFELWRTRNAERPEERRTALGAAAPVA